MQARRRAASRSRRPRFAACCRPRSCTCRARSATKCEAGDICAAILQQPKTHAAQLLAEQGVTRLDILDYISHGIAKVPAVRRADAGAARRDRRRRRRRIRRPRAIRSRPTASNLTERARQGQARSADRPRPTSCSAPSKCCAAAARTTRCSSARPASARPRWPKGSRRGCSAGRRAQSALKDAEVFALDTGALLAGTRFRGDFEERFKAVIAALSARPKAILFIDEMHSTVGAGATTGGTMDLATLHQADADGRRAARHRLDDVRGVQAHREGSRARAAAAEDRHRRAVDRRDGAGFSPGLRSRYEEHHRVTYTDARARGGRASWPSRHLRDYRLPDSAIDLIDEAGAVARLARPTSRANAATRRDPVVDVAGHRARRRAHGAHSGAAGVVVRSRAAADARGVAAARRVRPGRSGAPASRRRSSGRAPGSASRTGRPAASCSPGRPASARPSSPSSSRMQLGNEFSAST